MFTTQVHAYAHRVYLCQIVCHRVYEDCWTFQAFKDPQLNNFAQENTEISIEH